MHIGKYRIADVVIQIESLYPGIHRMCQGYICQENMPAQITVRIQPEDIAFEKHKSEQEALAEGKLPNDLHEGYLETLAVYRKLAEAMLAGQDTGCIDFPCIPTVACVNYSTARFVCTIIRYGETAFRLLNRYSVCETQPRCIFHQ